MIRTILLLPLALAICSGCSRKGPPVHFVVPNGFTGEIRLILDESRGAEIKLVDGKYTYRIPRSGVLQVTSHKPFERWHERTAAYEDGTPLPQDHETWTGPHGEKPKYGKNVVVFHGHALSQRDNEPPEMIYFVGSTLDYEEWAYKRAKGPYSSDAGPENR